MMLMYGSVIMYDNGMCLQDLSPRLQQSYELQTEAGKRNSRYNNLNIYMDSMAADSPDESVADDYAANNGYTASNSNSFSSNGNGYTSASKQLQQPPQDVG